MAGPDFGAARPLLRTIATTALLAGVATLAAVAVPESSLGFAARWQWPTPALLAAALAVAWSAGRRGGWQPLAAVVVLLVFPAAPTLPAAWTFHGWGAVVVWAVVFAAASQGRAVAAVAWSRHPRWHAALAAAAATVWLGGIAVAVSGHALTGDAPHYLTIARSLAADGDLDLTNDYDDRTYADFYAGSLEPRHTNTSPWGEQYPFHGIGVAVLVAPAFALWGVSGATATLVLLMATASALLWLAAWHLLRDAAAAWVGWAALVLTAPFALHAAAVYPDGPAAAAVAAALYLLARLHHRHPLSLWVLAAGSLGLAALPWLHARLAFPAGVFGLAILAAIWRGQPDRVARAAWFLMVPIISLAGWLAAAQVMFGTWNPSAAILQRTAPGTWADMGRGLVGLLVDQEYGLLPVAPVMALAAVAVPRFIRAFPAIGGATALMTGGVLAMSSLWMWWGGDSAPARFLVVALPALSLWLAHRWAIGDVGQRRVVVLLLAVTAAVTVLFATVEDGARAYAFADGRASVFAALSRSVDVGLALPALFRQEQTLAQALALAGVWLFAGGAACAAIARLPAPRGEPAAAGVGGAVLLVATMVAATVGWRVVGVTPWTTAGAALAWIQEAVGAPGVGLGIDSWRPRSADALSGGLALRTPETVPLAAPLLLYLPNLPAGDYVIRAATAPGATAAVQIELGRDAWPFAAWRPTDGEMRISLRTALHSLRVVGDLPPGAGIWLTPEHVDRQPPPGTARRVTRYGDLALYSMDDESYPDPGGTWVGGDRTSRMVVAPIGDPRAIDLTLEAGPAPVEVALAPGFSLPLTAGERRVVPLAGGEAVTVADVRVSVRGGFPAAALGNRSDGRTFGVRVTVSPR